MWKKHPREDMLLALKMEAEPRNAGGSKKLGKAKQILAESSPQKKNAAYQHLDVSPGCI